MPKVSESFNPSEYALVADRITMFYERYPAGRIVTELVSRDRDVVFKAAVFRDAADGLPAATGWASEREGDGDINLVACVENTETSAIGRALANLGFTASRKRASREEMEKAERARIRLGVSRGAQSEYPVPGRPPLVPAAAISPDAYEPPSHSSQRRDVASLADLAERAGLSRRRADLIRARAADPQTSRDELLDMSRRIRRWIGAKRDRAATLR